MYVWLVNIMYLSMDYYFKSSATIEGAPRFKKSYRHINMTDKTKMNGYPILSENRKHNNRTTSCKQITHASKRQSYITTNQIAAFYADYSRMLC